MLVDKMQSFDVTEDGDVCCGAVRGNSAGRKRGPQQLTLQALVQRKRPAMVAAAGMPCQGMYRL